MARAVADLASAHEASEGGASGREESSGKVGLTIPRRWTTPGKHPYDEVQWDRRSATISSEGGSTVFQQEDVEVPAFWSQRATQVVVSKYFRGHIGEPTRETSVRQMIDRVVNTITGWGDEQGYFATDEDREAFRAELTHLVLHQKMAFNSPVWFNVGWREKPAVSACFINSVEDSMESIMDLARTEVMIFRQGSGAGVNLSALRADGEKLSGGGTSSGPLSFMRGWDQFAGATKSGGGTRRAAKMILMDADHPDVEAFIDSKAHEEKKAWALIEQGYDGTYTGEAYGSVMYQNANHSVRVTDEFMRAVEADGEWELKGRVDGDVDRKVKARDIWRQIAEAAHLCGDPGLQFTTTINSWHTLPNTGPINASNPCSEYLSIDNSACNLASLNLLKFVGDDGEFDVEGFQHAVDVTITAQDIVVAKGAYPTPLIAENARKFRQLGLGYTNLGALLMSRGLAYDSDAGRDYAASITALMTGQAYRQSAVIARDHGAPFEGYEVNEKAMLGVMNRHLDAAYEVNDRVATPISNAAANAWFDAVHLGEDYGFRNAQATVLAPTGTISFQMDADTTGIEPAIGLVSYKKLVGGGDLKLVNHTVPTALKRLGYTADETTEILAHIEATDTIEGAPHLKPDHMPVFDCAFRATNGTRSISPMGHVRMVAAVQPFLSGTASKTTNLPTDATAEDIEDIYLQSWKLGLKAIAVYRDGSKRSQPLTMGKADTDGTAAELQAKLDAALAEAQKPHRRRLPAERQAVNHKFGISGHEGYITVGLYEDGQPGEIFLRMAKEGSTISGLMDSFATSISLALQYGVPLKSLVDKFSHMRFEPSGFTGNQEIPIAKSIVDYIFRWMGSRFLPREEAEAFGLVSQGAEQGNVTTYSATATIPVVTNGATTLVSNGADTRSVTITGLKASTVSYGDSPPCPECGTIMSRNNTCYRCDECGATTGCS